jgi:hypothetical protein
VTQLAARPGDLVCVCAQLMLCGVGWRGVVPESAAVQLSDVFPGN